VVLTGASSKQSALVRGLSASQQALLASSSASRQRRPDRQRQAQRRLTPEQARQLVAEYEGGASMKELAVRWGLHRTTVAAQLQLAGVRLRRQGLPADRVDEARRLYRDGWSLQRLAERYGCDTETVRQALKRAGVKLRAPWERIN
jgi:DNA-directed RNA polymerase specialized sigma24 family protein